MTAGIVALHALEVLRAMHDCDHDCTDGGWIKPAGTAADGDAPAEWPDIPPEWPCPTLRVIQAALGE